MGTKLKVPFKYFLACVCLMHMLDLSVSGVLRSCFFQKLTYNIENIYVIKAHICATADGWLVHSLKTKIHADTSRVGFSFSLNSMGASTTGVAV